MVDDKCKGLLAGVIAPPKTYISNFVISQFGKQYSRYKTILPSTDLSQQCCHVYFICVTIVSLQCDLVAKCYWNRPPKLTGWIRPCLLDRFVVVASGTGEPTEESAGSNTQ